MLLQLPPELLIRVISYVSDINDKCQLLCTCRHIHDFLCSHVICWSNLDLSPFHERLNNNALLAFLKHVNIPLYTSYRSLGEEEPIKTTIARLDVSGCWNLSDDLIVTLTKSLVNLKALCLNGYQLNASTLGPRRHKTLPSVAFEQRRDHVYQVRPSHDLSSMAMDLSKKSSHRLKVPLVLLCTIIAKLPHLVSLSIQYQDLSVQHASRTLFSEFKHLQHLDISSCQINQPTLQALIRTVGPNLLSLKMLNIDLNSLSCLSLAQFCKKLACLHLSCNDPSLLHPIRHVIGYLFHLKDFRLTRVRTGSLENIVLRLPLSLERLDMSPKMNVYPKSPTSSSTTHRRATRVQVQQQQQQQNNNSMSRKHPPQSPKLSIANYATTEHDLLFNDLCLTHISRCSKLVELRLCYPTITPEIMDYLFPSLPQLQVFELRLKKNQLDFLRGLKYCQQLRELALFSVFVSQQTIDKLVCEDSALRRTLRHVTLSDGGVILEQHVPTFLSLPLLETLCLGQLTYPFQWRTPVQDPHNVTLYKRQDHWLIQ